LKKFTTYLILSLFFFSTYGQTAVTGQKLSLDKGWRFHLGDIPFPIVKGHGFSYGTSKAGAATGAAAVNYDDQSWRKLNLPHDWAVEMPFDSTENISQGYRKRGYGWYRRSFQLTDADKGKNIELQFDGIATNATIWVNGTIVHHNFCGYTSSYIDITTLAKYDGEPNIIAVKVDAVAHEGWWYEGAGIYRHTWLVKRDALHIITDGVYANPIKKDDKWQIPAEITVANSGLKTELANVEVKVIDQNNKVLAASSVNVTVPVFGQATASVNLTIENPTLWSLENPKLYKVVTSVRKNGVNVDQLITKAGFRTIEFTADKGFFLNGKNIKLKGTCNHQDHAGVGNAVPDALWEFRIRRLKEMGSNAYRCSHNPPSVEFLDACDSLGMLVMDENRNFNTADEYIRQLQWLIRRDRNRPSVIIWSVFNEEPFQGDSRGYEMVRLMSAKVKELDQTRPVTAAQSGGQLSELNVSHAADVVGFNYQKDNYDEYHQKYPNKPMFSSEDVSAVMTRGIYVANKNRGYIPSYDENFQPWGSTNRVGWKLVDQRPYMAGCFVWTGFDYRGEPQPNEWPSTGSSFGIMDLCGFPKTAFWIHQAQWRKDIPVLQLVPHWNWPTDSIGKNIKVMAMTNADSIALFLNGKRIGGQKVDQYEMNFFKVPYQPGKLEAIGYSKDKKAVSKFVAETTSEPYRLQLIPDRKTLKNDGWDAMPITVQVLDKKGLPVPTANNRITFEISDGATNIGTGNGDPTNHESEKSNERSLFNGLAQLIIQSKEGATGTVTITAKSDGVKLATATVTLVNSAIPAFVPEFSTIINLNWIMSPFTKEKQDPVRLIGETDMNTWAPVKAGGLQSFTSGNFTVFRSTFTPFKKQQQRGATIKIKQLVGKAEIWLDGQLVKTKTTTVAEDVEIALPRKDGSRTLNIMVEAPKGSTAGLGGAVTVE